MNENIMQEIVHELFSSLEALETQSAAILQFLKDKGLAGEQELAPYLEQAGNASSVRWRAARVRIDYLISSAVKAEERDRNRESQKAKEDIQESSRNTGGQASGTNEDEKEEQNKQQVPPTRKSERSENGPSAGTNRSQTGTENGSRDQKAGENATETENAA